MEWMTYEPVRSVSALYANDFLLSDETILVALASVDGECELLFTTNELVVTTVRPGLNVKVERFAYSHISYSDVVFQELWDPARSRSTKRFRHSASPPPSRSSSSWLPPAAARAVEPPPFMICVQAGYRRSFSIGMEQRAMALAYYRALATLFYEKRHFGSAPDYSAVQRILAPYTLARPREDVRRVKVERDVTC